MDDMNQSVIDVRNLKVEFPGRRGTVTALSDISLSIRPGEILGVVGESGAGKSMTGLAIQGLLEKPGRIADGEIWLGSRRIDKLDDRAMESIRGREIGAIFQDPLTSLNPLFTVGAQLVETIRQHLPLSKKDAQARAVQLLRDVGIPSPADRIDHYPHQFSGGMRQRVVIALALAASPKLIIADEPTTALDVSIQAQIISLLRKLCKEKQTAVMLVTHDMGVIAEAADRVAVLYAGRLIEVGPVEQVLHAPKHPYTQGLMASIPSLGARVERLNQIDGAMPRLDAIPPGCAFNPRCGFSGPRCLRERPELEAAGDGASACWMNAGGTA
ncbi:MULTISPECIES: ABC transporter ATP-binding protein [Agrobacterium tumefaciens complex]|uniref:Oligopeptide ABC transporter (ATP-binding protein) n=1 Tax=Agrobacterium genomosp. 13 str. CFBP 6927 TaxID=1183428 RepID=A0ABP2BMG6_9HYPH|nr:MULTISPECIES: ABC transporter ATP-binding protein [Agrobacterium tumefaciens complex]CDN94702.1 ABC transporter, nucleotide binding/ATPase protein (Oligopeptide) [Agrobacterium tumefaciens]CUX56896.1 putative oligopeptide ABC transporter (ATP-binding protein) [Agrobacterium genomosp. 13 str. CFBP 6927]